MADTQTSLETTKRKFYKLLDNFSSSRVSLHQDSTARPSLSRGSESGHDTTDLTEPPNKRSRFSFVGRISDEKRTSKVRPLSMPAVEGVRAVTPEEDNPEARKEFVPREELRRLVEERRARKAADEAQARSKQPFKYAPWSHDLFLERLKTFADIKIWSPKPEGLGEVEWAKRGWVCQSGGAQGKDGVFCRMCEKRVAIVLNKDKKPGTGEEVVKWWHQEAQKDLIARYQRLIVEGHDESCLWRTHGCKNDIYRMKMADPGIWQPELRTRYQSLAAFGSSLPKSIVLPEISPESDYNFDIARMAPALQTMLRDPVDKLIDKEARTTAVPAIDTENAAATSETPTASQVNITALSLAVCGWYGVKTSGIELVHCNTCFQRCGLWLYNGKTAGPPRSTSSISTPEKEPLVFNPIDLHRIYCPWRSATSQSAEGSFQGLNGWQILVSLIQYVVERHERQQKTAEIERMEADGIDTFEEKSWDEVMEHDREMEGRIAKIRKAFTTLKRRSRPGTGSSEVQDKKEKRRSFGLLGGSSSRPQSAT